jgi:UDP-N-acetylmuramoyl-tripeptide--D-alanyl-D-alanine ligase
MIVEKIHQIFLSSNGVVTDTRKIKPNTIFFALKGDNFNGNEFAQQAIDLGCSYAIIDDSMVAINDRFVLVENVLDSLQQLAKFHRNYLGLKIVALTGSNGKTTTKELFHAVLSQKYNCKATIGNLNNHIGVPLTLLSFDKSTEIGVVEMGANHQKEIAFLCEIAQPDIGYITNFGKAHLEGFGGVEGVIKGKSEMYDFLRHNGKMMLINTDDPIQNERSKGINERVAFSISDLKIKLFDGQRAESQCLSFYVGDHLVETQLYGSYNLSNCMSAIALGLYFDISIFEVINAINQYSPSNHRSQWLEKGNLKIVLDAYNANPSSMMHAIRDFVLIQNSNKAIILGDMFELGIASENEHQKIIDMLSDNPDINTFFVGQNFYALKKRHLGRQHLKFFENTQALIDAIDQVKDSTQLLLIKGSRGMQLEKIIDFI